MAGYKYLVWEMVCQATGGPHKYTGTDMKAAHAHMKISQETWGAFARLFVETLNEFKVPEQEQKEVFLAASHGWLSNT